MDTILTQFSSSCPSGINGTAAELFLMLIQTLVSAKCDIKTPEIEDYGPNLVDMDIFHYVVIGAGSAGSVVANRLSEVPEWSVLVLEAGEIPSSMSQIPPLMFNLIDSNETWHHEVASQKFNCQGMKNKKCKLYTGKALGGSSSVNAMLYVRGNKQDYDNWESLGNPGWGFDNTLEYFKKSEDNEEHYENEDYHGSNGYQKVGNFDYDIPIKRIMREAAEELNIPTVKDIHNGTYIHYGPAQGTVHQGTRHSTYESFLHTVKDRKNLKVVMKAEVTKIIIHHETNEVLAVEYKHNDEIKRVRVRNEAIISAGALKTPQILMLSGIGPQKHLEELEIPVLQNLNVGQNLQDHILHSGIYVKIPNELGDTGTLFIDELYNYFMHRKGLLTTFALTNFLGFVNTLKNSEYPDVQYIHIIYPPKDILGLPLFLHAEELNDDISEQLLEINQNATLLQILPTLLRPKSKGFVKLQSSFPFDKPIITHNYLKEKEDVETLVRGIKFVQELLKTKSFSKYNPEIVKINIPECDQHEFASDEYWRCSLKYTATTVYHYSGTVKMGPDTDTNAVVTPRLSVRGIKKLRVIDASIMPNIVSANTNAVSIMIGEKGADLIKEDWKVSENMKKDEL